MKLLSFDPGAERMGYACLEGDGTLTAKSWGYGYLGVERASNGSKKEEYQKYRLRLIKFWAEEADYLFTTFKPDEMVNELIPPVGGAAFASNGLQAQLAMAALSVLQGAAYRHDVPVTQIAAQTVKKAVGGSYKATKVKVRNGVFLLMPQLAFHRKEWTRMFDISDAFAVGLTHMGYQSMLGS